MMNDGMQSGRMRIGNKQYREWMLVSQLKTLIQDVDQGVVHVLAENYGTLLEEAVQGQRNVSFSFGLDTTVPNALPHEHVAIMKPLSPLESRYVETLKSRGAAIWNIWSSWELYEEKRRPQNYIINDFRDFSERESCERLAERDRESSEFIDYYIHLRYKGHQKALFNKVEIETINRCSGSCEFCPVAKGRDPRLFSKMSDSLFKRIIDQLHTLSYRGALALFSNNEPLLDTRLAGFASYARTMLPEAFIYIFTNGELMTKALLDELSGSLDLIHINCYSKHGDLPGHFQDLHQYICEKKPPEGSIVFHIRNQNEVMSSRAGSAPNRKNFDNSIASCCTLPFSQMIIRPDGGISQCCNDALGRVTLGSAATDQLSSLWFSDAFEKIRSGLFTQGRRSNELCASCDAVFRCLPFEDGR